MSGIECSACGLMPSDLPDDVDPEMVFEFDEPSRTYHCVTCEPLSSDPDWIAESRLQARDYDAWAAL